MLFCPGQKRCGWWIHPRPAICRLIRLDPDHILTPAVAPFRQHFATPFETLARPTSDPEKDKTRIPSERRYIYLLQMVPCKCRRERWVDQYYVEL